MKIMGTAFPAKTHSWQGGLRFTGVVRPRCDSNPIWLQPVTSLNFGKLHGLKPMRRVFDRHNVGQAVMRTSRQSGVPHTGDGDDSANRAGPVPVRHPKPGTSWRPDRAVRRGFRWDKPRGDRWHRKLGLRGFLPLPTARCNSRDDVRARHWR